MSKDAVALMYFTPRQGMCRAGHVSGWIFKMHIANMQMLVTISLAMTPVCVNAQ